MGGRCGPVMWGRAGAVLWGRARAMMGGYDCAMMGQWGSVMGQWAWSMVGHGAGVMRCSVMDKWSRCYIMMDLMMNCSEGGGVHIGGGCGW